MFKNIMSRRRRTPGNKGATYLKLSFFKFSFINSSCCAVALALANYQNVRLAMLLSSSRFLKRLKVGRDWRAESLKGYRIECEERVSDRCQSG